MTESWPLRIRPRHSKRQTQLFFFRHINLFFFFFFFFFFKLRYALCYNTENMIQNKPSPKPASCSELGACVKLIKKSRCYSGFCRRRYKPISRNKSLNEEQKTLWPSYFLEEDPSEEKRKKSPRPAKDENEALMKYAGIKTVCFVFIKHPSYKRSVQSSFKADPSLYFKTSGVS